jgi:hypothetical protein
MAYDMLPECSCKCKDIKNTRMDLENGSRTNLIRKKHNVPNHKIFLLTHECSLLSTLYGRWKKGDDDAELTWMHQKNQLHQFEESVK